jgi:AcrR family transcriptional regulator
MSELSPGPRGPAGAGTRDRILQAAYDLFARLGFSRVSMRQVAAAAGVTKPALYYHFRDKESLFEECLADFDEALARTMRRAAKRRGSVDDRVRAVAETLLSGSPFHPVRVHDELDDRAAEPLRQRLRASFTTVVVAPVTDLFAALAAEGHLRRGIDPADAAAVLIGTCLAFMPHRPGSAGWAPLPTGSRALAPQAAAARVTELVLRGVGG